MQHELFKLGHIGMGHTLGGIIMRQSTEHPAHRVAQFAIGLDKGFQDFFADAQIVRIVGRSHPQAQNVSARILDDILRRRNIAERLRHFLAFFIQNEAMRQHNIKRRTPARAAALKQ